MSSLADGEKKGSAIDGRNLCESHFGKELSQGFLVRADGPLQCKVGVEFYSLVLT